MTEDEITETKLRRQGNEVVVDIPDELDQGEEIERLAEVTEIMDDHMANDDSITQEEMEKINEELDERFN